MITIVDYGIGNINAFINIFQEQGIECSLAQTPDQLMKAKKIILPGVGHFDFAMEKLEESGMIDMLHQQVIMHKIPILGICVGMQMMADSSEEGNRKGLGWIKSKVVKIDTSALHQNTLLPHMGWNTVSKKKDSILFHNINEAEDFYFLHSYCMDCDEEQNIIATTYYGNEITVVVQKDNIYGIQCHPEKSHLAGMEFLKNFANI